MTANQLTDGTVAINSTTTDNFDKTVVALVNKRLEEELRNPLPHLLPGNFRPAQFVQGTNNTMRFIRIADMPVVTGTPTPGTSPWLDEGITPATEDLDIGYEEFSANQAGRLIKLTDKALLQNPFDLLVVGAERVARNAIATADKRVADVIAAGTHVIYPDVATSTATVDAGDVVTSHELKRAVATLRADNVPTFPDGFYHSIIHPGVVLDIEEDTDAGGWIDVLRYANPDTMLRGELGTYAGIKFVQSAAAAVKTGQGSGSVDVYSTVIFGTEAYAFGDWETISTHVTPPGGQADPLKQRAFIGWKGYFGAMLMGEGANADEPTGPRYIRIESTSSL